MNDDLRVGFFRFDAYAPGAAACAPAVPTGKCEFVTIGGPRKREQVAAELVACERMVESLRRELAGFEQPQEVKP